MKRQRTQNKSATESAGSPAPTSLAESNAAADKRQEESNARAAELASSGELPSREELATSGYRLPESYFEQNDPNADQRSAEQRSGDGGAGLSE